ncbi:hypothetical protein [Cellulomonas sp. P5_E12]
MVKLFRRRVDWVLADGVERHALSPSTFRIVDDEAKAALREGDRVKVMVVPSEGIAERLWVVVSSVGDEVLHGTFASDAVELRGLHAGDVVTFERRHVLGIGRRDA